MSIKLSTRGIKRLEVTMRDVLDGLEDAASYMNYRSSPDIVEILSIEAPGRPAPALSEQKVIPINLPIDNNANANIVDYLIQRELKRIA